MKKVFFFIAFSMSLYSATKGQNPYQSIGKPLPKGKMLTLSNGKFQEFFSNDTLVPIGSVMYNTVTGQVVAFLTRDTMYAEYNLEPEVTSRWLSPDPLAAKYPQWSPYNYVENNPIQNIDPDGLFSIPVHRQIITEALLRITKAGTNMTQYQPKLMSGNVETDYVCFACDAHFDGKRNSAAVTQTWNQLNEHIANTNIKTIEENEINGIAKMGQLLHTVQDFYAHSNYVELYVQYYQESGKDMANFDPKAIPTYNEAIAAGGAFVDKYLNNPKAGIKTGEFNVVPWVIGVDGAIVHSKGLTHHDDLNKDEPTEGKGGTNVAGTNLKWHDLAKEVATKETVNILNEQVEEKK
jgi:hypothetical protein